MNPPCGVLRLQALIMSFLIVLQTEMTFEKEGGHKMAPKVGRFTPSEGEDEANGQTVIFETESGKIKGEMYVLEDRSRGIRFLGIPYAMPPVGERRFKDPEPVGSWKGIKDTTKFGPICFQPLGSDVWDMVTSEILKNDGLTTENPDRLAEKLRNRIHQVEDLVNEMKMNKEHFGNSSKYLKNTILEMYVSSGDFFHSSNKPTNTDGEILKPLTTAQNGSTAEPFANGTSSKTTITTTTSTSSSTSSSSSSEEDLHPKDHNNKTYINSLLPINDHVNNSSKIENVVKDTKPRQSIRRKIKSRERNTVKKRNTEKLLFIERNHMSDYKMAEDCLTLNIYAPLISHRNEEKDKLYPVVVYIHGGSFYSNGGRFYPGERLAAEGVVVVTVNYRLGPFGFLSTGDSVARGNWGLHDQRMALMWIQKHLKAFRGDKNKVLLVGNSAGGSSVVLQMLSPLSKGLFTRVAAMSGCSLAPWSIQSNPLKAAKKLASGLNCPLETSEGIVECLRKITAEALNKEFTNNIVLNDGLWLSFAPVVEGSAFPGAFLSHPPRQLLKEGAFHKVPLLLSLTKDEVTIWFRDHSKMIQKLKVEELINRIIKQFYPHLDKVALGPVSHVIRGFYIYSKGYSPSSMPTHEEGELGSLPQQQDVPIKILANLYSDLGLRVPCMEEAKLLSKWIPTYLSEFTYASPDDVRMGNKRWIGSYHESDLQYMLGQPLFGLTNSLRHQNDKKVAHLTMEIMKSFAVYGVPKLPPEMNVTWPKYNMSNKIHLEICDQPKLGRELLQDKLYFWLKFVPLLVEWPYQVLTSNAACMNSLPLQYLTPVSIATGIILLMSIFRV